MYKSIIFICLIYLSGCSKLTTIKLINVSKISKHQYLLVRKRVTPIKTSYGPPVKKYTPDLYGNGDVFYKLSFITTIELNKKQTNIVGIVPIIWECDSKQELMPIYNVYNVYNVYNKHYFTLFPAQDYYGKNKYNYLNEPKDLCFLVKGISMLGDRKSNTIRISKQLLK